MISTLDRRIPELGDGTIVRLKSGESLFKFDSCPDNPIVKPQDIGLTWQEDGEIKIGAVFNGGAELFQDKVILTPRCHRGYHRSMFFDEKLGIKRYCLENYISEIWPLVSEDGIHFTRFQNVVIRGDGTDHQDFTYGIEDIRIIRHDQTYLLVGCGKTKPPFKGESADRIAVYTTDDFVNITYHGIVDSFDSRNAIPFLDSGNDHPYMLLRFHPNVHLDSLEAAMDQLLDPANHNSAWQEIYNRRSRSLLLEAGRFPHEKEKIGPSTQLIKTERGWLLIYHAVGQIDLAICKLYGLSEKIERGYSVCAALLSLNDPTKVLCRTKYPIYIPSAPWELGGDKRYPVDVPAVVFPMGAIARNDKLLLYCGAGDKYITLLTCSLNSLVEYLWAYCRL